MSTTLATAWTTFWNTTTNGYKNLCGTTVTCFSADAYLVNSSWRTLSKTSTGLSLVGVDAGGSLPFSTTAMIEMTNSADTKSDRGWIKLPSPAKSQAAGDTLVAGFMTSLKTVFDPFVTTMSGLTAFHFVSYNKHVNKQGEAPFTIHLLTGYNLPSKTYSARFRSRKVVPTRATTGTLP
jgi:hypothetical protein